MNGRRDYAVGEPPPRERVTVVRDIDGFQRAAAIRAIVYMAEQDCPYVEEFDGNDLCGLHLLGWVAGEPAACLRLRFFADFVKVERLAVRREFRVSGIAFRLVRFALRLAARKGYRKAYGHAQEGLEPFWSRFGARAVGPQGAFGFSGRRYTEMLLDLPADPAAIGLGADPLILLRPEGDWDRPGVLEGAPASVPADPADIRYDLAPEPAVPGWTAAAAEAWREWGGGFREEDAGTACGPPQAARPSDRSFIVRIARGGVHRRPGRRRSVGAASCDRRIARWGACSETKKPRRWGRGFRCNAQATYSQTRTRRITTVS